jgi:hypothetical protein
MIKIDMFYKNSIPYHSISDWMWIGNNGKEGAYYEFKFTKCNNP